MAMGGLVATPTSRETWKLSGVGLKAGSERAIAVPSPENDCMGRVVFRPSVHLSVSTSS